MNEIDSKNSEENNLKSEYELKKENKEREIQGQVRKAKIAKRLRRLVWMMGVLIVVWGVVRFIGRDDDQQGETAGDYFPAQSRDHIAVGATHAAYNSNPPTGGWHYAEPAKTGIYDQELPDEQLIHNLEHSHIWVAYRPDLAQDQIEALANIVQNYGSRIIMTPRGANDTPITIVAWEHLLRLDTVDKAKIGSFVKIHRNKAGPEKNIPDFEFKDWRTKK